MGKLLSYQTDLIEFQVVYKSARWLNYLYSNFLKRRNDFKTLQSIFWKNSVENMFMVEEPLRV